MNQDLEKSLKLTTDQIEHKFGKGSIMKLGEGGQNLEVGRHTYGRSSSRCGARHRRRSSRAHRRDLRSRIKR